MPDGSPLFWPIEKLIRAYRREELSPLEVTREALMRVEAFNERLHAVLTPMAELALAQGREAEQRYPSGDIAPLLGVPVSVKDLFPVKGTVTTFGSVAYRDNVSACDSGRCAA